MIILTFPTKRENKNLVYIIENIYQVALKHEQVQVNGGAGACILFRVSASSAQKQGIRERDKRLGEPDESKRVKKLAGSFQIC